MVYSLFTSPWVFAAGLGIFPAEYLAQVTEGDLETFTIEVFNTAREPGMFHVYADEQIAWFVISPEQFRLDPDSSERVKVIVQPDAPGKHIVNLSVVGRSLERQSFNAASGLKFPVTLTVAAGNANELAWLHIIFGTAALATVVVGTALGIERKRRSRLEKITDTLDLLLHHKQKWYHKILRLFK